MWLPTVHLLFRPALEVVRPAEGISPEARGLLRRGLARWGEAAAGAGSGDARRGNPEWDLMARSLLGWSLAEAALRDPGGRADHLAALDGILEATLADEREGGFHRFLLPYARESRYRRRPTRSLFVDGEIALSLGLRQLVEPAERWRGPLRERVRTIIERVESAPALLCESYPDECWLFDHATALAAVRVHDAVEGEDHGPLLRRWSAMARERLADPATGLLRSAFTLEGRVLQGPEGSSIWMALHHLRLVDPDLAADQYRRARAELGGSLLGFGYAREWPRSAPGRPDIDSGVVLPLLDAGPASSGLALVAAASFGDGPFLRSLLGSLALAGFPVEGEDGLRYAMGNEVGDAAILYALVLGPAWDEVGRRGRR